MVHSFGGQHFLNGHFSAVAFCRTHEMSSYFLIFAGPAMKNFLSRIFLCCLICGSYPFAGAQYLYLPSDRAGGALEPYTSPTDHKYRELEIQRQYITMPDGTQLAADIYLPGSRKKNEKFPVILHQTRYWRAPQIRWPFSMFTNGLLGIYGEMIKRFVAAGYVIVNVDVRGTGASFGRNDYPWSEQEVQDGYDVCNWITEQSWADGKIGSVGGSYSGTAAEFLASKCHPGVKAVALLYSLYDVYDDIAFPNGNHFEWFTTNWGDANTQLDNNHLPVKDPLIKMMVSGVAKVPGKKKNGTYRDAIRSHKDNIGVNETSRGVDYRDLPPANGMVSSVDFFSPHTVTAKINDCGVAVYCYSGWYDGDYPHASVKRYLNLTGDKKQLLLGPWNHGGKYNCSPGNPGMANFDHAAELLRFFDHHLRGFDNGLEKRPPVHYYTMVEERWKSSGAWPPAGFTHTPMYLTQDAGLVDTVNAAGDGVLRYVVNNTIGTGNDTRWKSLKSELKTPYAYSDLKERLAHAQRFTSQPLEHTVEITGHPMAYLYISSTHNDGSFYTYLVDEHPDGSWSYVTEGSLRILHRKPGDCPYADAVPCHSYRKEDGMPLQPGAVDLLMFDLLPVSYQVKKGHKLVVCMANTDVDHFKTYQPDGTELTIYMSAQYPTRIELPLKVAE